MRLFPDFMAGNFTFIFKDTWKDVVWNSLNGREGLKFLVSEGLEMWGFLQFLRK